MSSQAKKTHQNYKGAFFQQYHNQKIGASWQREEDQDSKAGNAPQWRRAVIEEQAPGNTVSHTIVHKWRVQKQEVFH